jgi:4-hydroxy-tetrahydrodipicolinate synthase
MSAYRGLIPPICTPLTASGGVDVDSLRDLIDFQLSAGASGIFILGSSGEAIYLDDANRRLVAETARAAVGDRAPLLVGALAPTANRVVQQIRLLEPTGPDAFVVTAPFYAQPSNREIASHFRLAAAASPVPVLAYDIPGNVGYKLPADVSVELLSDGVIAGLKDSSGDVDEFEQIARRLGSAKSGALLSGADTTALRALDAGADGLIPGLANIRPDLFAALIEAHRSQHHVRAGALQRAISTLNDIFRVGVKYGLGRHASEIGALKHVLADRGVIADATSPCPLEPYPAEAREEALALAASIDHQLARELAEAAESGVTDV